MATFEVFHHDKLIGMVSGWRSASSAKVSAARQFDVPYRELTLRRVAEPVLLSEPK